MSTLDALTAEINANLPTNHNNQLQAAIVRQTLIDMCTEILADVAAAAHPPISITGTGDPGLTRAQAIASTFAAPPNAIKTIGYDTPGDLGGGLHVRVETEPTHPGYFTTADGSFYELVAENNEINIAQFGAKPLPFYNVEDPSVDCYPAFLACDKYLFNDGTGTRRGIRVIVPPLVYYTTKTINIRRCAWHLIGATGGNDSLIRAPWNVSPIAINGNQGGSGIGAGADYSLFPYGYVNMSVGQAFFRSADQTFPGAVYRCVTAGVGGGASGPDDPITGTDPTHIYQGTNPGALAQFKYETSIGPDTAFDYDITNSLNGAGGTIIENLTFWSFWGGVGGTNGVFPDEDPDISGEPQYRAGVIMRIRAIIRNCFFSSFNGFGLAIVGDGDPSLKGVGNVNGFDVEHIVISGNGKAGYHIGYSDANAGSSRYIDSSYNGRCGIEDFNFLGNSHEDAQFAFDGNYGVAQKQYPSACTYDGNVWSVRIWINGGDVQPQYINEEPGITYLDPGGSGANVIPWIPNFGANDQDIGCVITGSIAGNTLTVTAIVSGSSPIAMGNMICTRSYTVTSGRVRPGTKIVAQLTGTTGGIGTYTVNGASQTVVSMDMAVMLMYTQAIVVGSISGTTLTVTSVISGSVTGPSSFLQIDTFDDTITSGRIKQSTSIYPLSGPGSGTGTGGVGTYTVDKAQTVASQTIRVMFWAQRFAPPWTAQQRFEWSAAFASNNVNARNVWKYNYCEQGTGGPQPGPKDLCLGGPQNSTTDTTRGAIIFDENAWSRLQQRAQVSPREGGGGSRQRTAQISSSGFEDPTIFAWSTWDSRHYSILFTGGTGPDGVNQPDIMFTDLANGTSPTYCFMRWISGANGQAAFGRPSPIGLATFVNNLVIGDSGGDGRLVQYVDVGPTSSGYHAAGEIELNKFTSMGHASGVPWGWMCTISGTPGTWIVLGTIP